MGCHLNAKRLGALHQDELRGHVPAMLGRAVSLHGLKGKNEEGGREAGGQCGRNVPEPSGGQETQWLQQHPKTFKLTTVAMPAAAFMDVSSAVMARLRLSREAELVPHSTVPRPHPNFPVMSSFRCNARDT